MTGLSLALVLLSSLAHSTWNLLLKRSVNKEVFVWWMLVSGSILLAPLGAVLLRLYPISPPGWWLLSASTVLEIFYVILLGRSYDRGDLSQVYPIARGIAPMLAPVLAVLTLGERIELPAILGIGLIVVGIYIVSWWGKFGSILRQPLALLGNSGARYALLTGLIITVYSLVDKRGVEYAQPFLYMYLLTLGSAIGLTPYVLHNYGLAPTRREWQRNSRHIVAAGALFFAAYGLVLTAFSLSQVSYIAPAREVGIVIGVLMGVFILKEPFGRGRLLGSGFIVWGLALIAWPR